MCPPSVYQTTLTSPGAAGIPLPRLGSFAWFEAVMLPWRLSPKQPQTSAPEPAKPAPLPPTEAEEAGPGPGIGRAEAREALVADSSRSEGSDRAQPPRAGAARHSASQARVDMDSARGDFPLSGRLGAVPQE